MRTFFAISIVSSLLILGHGTAQAVPILQLYLEGGTYDTVTESWVLTPPGSSGGNPFRLWAIGNVDGPGGKGDISAVRLAIAYSSDGPTPNITLAGSTTGGFGGFTDPSVAGAATLIQTVTDGSSPVLGDGKPLPSHGIYGPGTAWQEYLLGDFTLKDSPVADFIGSFPTALFPGSGQISVYEVSVLGGSGATLHFDLYNHVGGANHAKFAPFSHDADADANIIPEPSAYLVWLLIGLTWAGSAWMYRYSSWWRELEKEVAFAVAPAASSIRPEPIPERPRRFLRRLRPLQPHRPTKPR